MSAGLSCSMRLLRPDALEAQLPPVSVRRGGEKIAKCREALCEVKAHGTVAAADAVCPAFVLTAGGSRLLLGGWQTPLCCSVIL